MKKGGGGGAGGFDIGRGVGIFFLPTPRSKSNPEFVLPTLRLVDMSERGRRDDDSQTESEADSALITLTDHAAEPDEVCSIPGFVMYVSYLKPDITSIKVPKTS